MIKKFVLFLILGCILFASIFAKEASVLVIGGGPSGLATAIEAKEAGYHVTVVEKRSVYERRQTLFLLGQTLELLKKWKVVLPTMKVVETQGFTLGIVPIQDLEMGLEKRALAMGIQKIRGEFIAFNGTKQEVVIATEAEECLFGYDFIVGADGAHSRVREALGIRLKILGEATAASALILCESAMDISPIIEKNGFFLRKIGLGKGSLVFMQGSSKNASLKKNMQQAVKACGWKNEAEALRAKKEAFFADNISVILSQGAQFSNESRKALLVGDAAATASFLQGMGANTGLKTAALAGDFFKSKAYDSFEEGMQSATDALIEDSRCLFP